MSTTASRSVIAGLTLVLSAALVACSPEMTSETPPSATARPSPAEDGSRFLIECVGPEGTAIGPFTGLEEAWASTNYVRIDHCSAISATDQPVELTPGEESIARTAAPDVPDEDPVDLYLWTLATCVRVSPTSSEGLSTLPTSLLRATLELCPQAPHAGLVEDELRVRS